MRQRQRQRQWQWQRRRWAAGLALMITCAPEPPAPLDLPGSVRDRRNREVLAENAVFFDEAARVPVGGTLARPALDAARLGRLGLVPAGPGRFRRLVRADAAAHGGLPPARPLVPTEAPDLPHVDAVAVTASARPGHAPPPVYASLRSLFAAFPTGVEVNVLVGGGAAPDLSEARLAAELGAGRAEHVHVLGLPAEVEAHLAGWTAREQGAWAFARALLSYRGGRGLVVVADDVAWAADGAQVLEGLVSGGGVACVSLYNRWCDELTPHRREAARWRGFRLEVPADAFGVPAGAQGFWLSAAVATDLGRHLLLRVHPGSWAAEVGAFLGLHALEVGYPLPSLLQHEGPAAGGEVPSHRSACFPGPA